MKMPYLLLEPTPCSVPAETNWLAAGDNDKDMIII